MSLRIQDGDSAEEVPFGDVLTNPDDVERRIRQAQRALLRPSLEPHTFLDDSDLNLRGGHILSFTDNCVCVHIRGPDVTDLHFYDLPGTRSSACCCLLTRTRNRDHCERRRGSEHIGHRTRSLNGQALHLAAGLHYSPRCVLRE